MDAKKRRGKPHIRSDHPLYSQDPNRLLNERQEAYAMYFATPDENGRFREKTEAYRMAYPTASVRTAQKASANVAKMPAWQKRVAEIREKRFAKIEIDQEWFNREFKKRYDVNIADYWKTVEVDAKGNQYPLGEAPDAECAEGETPTKIATRIEQVPKRLDELTRDQQLMLDAYTVERMARGSIKTEFKLDKKGALDSLARGFGYFKDKVDVTSGGKPIGAIALMGFDQLSAEDLDERIRALESRKAEAPLSE